MVCGGVVCTGIYDPPNVVCFSIVCNEISQTQCTMCIEMNASMYDHNVCSVLLCIFGSSILLLPLLLLEQALLHPPLFGPTTTSVCWLAESEQ